MENLTGVRKNVPDESLVKVHDRLIVPPRLSLRPPIAPPPDDIGSVSSDTDDVIIRDSVLPPEGVSVIKSGVSASDGLSSGSDLPSNEGLRSAEDIFAEYGISRTRSDGTVKSDEEMLEELRTARDEALGEKDGSSDGGGFSLERIFENFSLGGLLGL